MLILLRNRNFCLSLLSLYKHFMLKILLHVQSRLYSMMHIALNILLPSHQQLPMFFISVGAVLNYFYMDIFKDDTNKSDYSYKEGSKSQWSDMIEYSTEASEDRCCGISFLKVPDRSWRADPKGLNCWEKVDNPEY